VKLEPGAIVIWTFVAVAGVLSAHQLIDPDLGWNLASGRWIALHGRLPLEDPFAIDSAPWVDYCWLPQVLFYGVYALFGFQGLLSLQTALCCLSAVLGLALIGVTGRRRSEIVYAGALLLFIVPIFHLRPQLLSLILFQWFLLWRRRVGRSNAELALILLLWVNTHVYWIFGPLIVLWDRRNKREVLLAGISCLLSPYGVLNLLPVYQYAFEHSHTKGMVREFQSVAQVGGYLLPVCVALFCWQLYRRRDREVVLNGGFFALSFFQMKFAPLFGVKSLAGEVGRTNASLVALHGMLATAICALGVLVFVPSPVRDAEADLLDIGEKLSAEHGVIGNTFDDGGWLELGLSLPKSDGSPTMRPVIDGRTLVMGKDRLVKFHQVMKGEFSYCRFIREWGAQYVVTKNALRTLERLTHEGCSYSEPLYSGAVYELRRLEGLQGAQPKAAN